MDLVTCPAGAGFGRSVRRYPARWRPAFPGAAFRPPWRGSGFRTTTPSGHAGDEVADRAYHQGGRPGGREDHPHARGCPVLCAILDLGPSARRAHDCDPRSPSRSIVSRRAGCRPCFPSACPAPGADGAVSRPVGRVVTGGAPFFFGTAPVEPQRIEFEASPRQCEREDDAHLDEAKPAKLHEDIPNCSSVIPSRALLCGRGSLRTGQSRPALLAPLQAVEKLDQPDNP